MKFIPLLDKSWCWYIISRIIYEKYKCYIRLHSARTGWKFGYMPKVYGPKKIVSSFNLMLRKCSMVNTTLTHNSVPNMLRRGPKAYLYKLYSINSYFHVDCQNICILICQIFGLNEHVSLLHTKLWRITDHALL